MQLGKFKKQKSQQDLKVVLGGHRVGQHPASIAETLNPPRHFQQLRCIGNVSLHHIPSPVLSLLLFYPSQRSANGTDNQCQQDDSQEVCSLADLVLLGKSEKLCLPQNILLLEKIFNKQVYLRLTRHCAVQTLHSRMQWPWWQRQRRTALCKPNGFHSSCFKY